MIKIYQNGAPLDAVYARSQLNDESLIRSVKSICDDVQKRGDQALINYSKSFDRIDLEEVGFEVTDDEFRRAYDEVSEEMLGSLRHAICNVTQYHQAHKTEDKLLSNGTKTTGILVRPVGRAGIYVPGGTAPYPSSVLMTALPAKAAGVPEIIMCSPNPKNALTLVAAKECGVDRVFRLGGAQAIAAMAYGTQSVPKVDVIAGPGNIFVTLAKKEVFGKVKVDMIAGPSEILIIADNGANPVHAAADLLSQAEHDKMSASILITTSADLAVAVQQEVEKQLAELPREEIARVSIENNGAIIIVNSLQQAVEIANKIAPEHLELMVKEPSELLPMVQTAGAVFAGYHTPEPLGDYYAGPSHVLPTSGTAKHFEVLNTDTFLRKMSYISYSAQDLQEVGADVMRMADAEGFTAHRNSVKKRLS